MEQLCPKITMIGAGSVVFTRHLIRDLLSVPAFAHTHFALHDISPANLDMAERLAVKDVKGNGLPTTISATTDRRVALRDADYVVNLTRIGGLDAFTSDIEIPLTYGVDQCVGDTLCAGGILYGQRNVPAILDFLRDVRDVAKPGAIFFNYANPMAINCWAALDAFPEIKTIGFCHGVEHGWDQIAEALGGKYGPNADGRGVDGSCIGINHQTWYTDVRIDGRRVEADELLAAFERHPKFSRTEKCRIDVLKRFGFYSTESNGHLSEYLPWYRKRPADIRKWTDDSLWIHGETGGYLRLCTEARNWFETDFPRWLEAKDEPITLATRSQERFSYVIEALETGRRIRTYMNLRNDGCVTNLADDCVVEVPVIVDGLGVHVPKAGKLPQACAATCTASINVQRMAKDAALTGDVLLLKQAMLHDPLVGAVCDPEEVWQMTDEMLLAQAQWLPQYATAIEGIRRRAAVRRPPAAEVAFAGSTRRRIRSVGEMRDDPQDLAWLGSTKTTID